MKEQPEALRLAEHLENFRSFPDDLAAAAALRRLHERDVKADTQIKELLQIIEDFEHHTELLWQRVNELESLSEALKGLISWIPSADTYRRMGFDPEAPMRALEEARTALTAQQGVHQQGLSE